MVEEPATDRDSDHTDIDESVDSKNTCELVVASCNFFGTLIPLPHTQAPPSF